jgi:peptidoglycan/LPS O-acetylase OafA/YrhL
MLLGDASFSIYLTHYYLILESDWQFLRHPGIAATIGHDAARVLALVVILAIGIAFWALVERPLLHALRPSAPSPP